MSKSVRCGITVDTLRGSSIKIGTMQIRLAWPLCKDDQNLKCLPEFRLSFGITYIYIYIYIYFGSRLTSHMGCRVGLTCVAILAHVVSHSGHCQ